MKKNILTLLLVGLLSVSIIGCNNTANSGNTASNNSKSSKDVESAAPVSENNEIFNVTPEGFRVVTVGTGNPKLSTSQGGASTLVQYKDKYFLVDCGFNSIATLMDLGLPCENITNMLFTHQHNDHNADFWTFFVGGWGSPTGRRSLNLVGPGVQKLYDLTTEFYTTDLEYRSSLPNYGKGGIYEDVNITDFTEDNYSIEIDGVKITSIPVPHTIETYAYRFEAGGESVVISGDLTYIDTFAEFAKDADILVMDGMLTSDFSDLPEEAREGMKKSLSKSHISSDEIGQIAAASNCKKLVMTHLSEGTPDKTINETYKSLGYEGSIIFATDGMVIEP